MKLRYIIAAIASTAVLAGCQTEPMVGSFADFTLDKTFVSIPLEGGSADVAITAADAWEVTKHFDTGKKDDEKKAIMDYAPEWVTLSSTNGAAGQSKLTITATATESGRQVELQLKSGSKLQHIIVRQGSVEPEEATCAEVIAGPDGKSYIVKGTVTSIVNTTYGNWYLKDDAGDEVYIYGTKDKDGKTKNFLSLGIEVGDVVKVSGPKTTYNGTVELVDVTVLSIDKALLSVLSEPVALEQPGGDFVVKIAHKGKGVYVTIPEDAREWLSLTGSSYTPGVPTLFEKNPADTSYFSFTAVENPGDLTRNAEILFVSSMLDDENKTVSTEAIYKVSQKGNWIPNTVAEVVSLLPEDRTSTESVSFSARLNGAVVTYVNGRNGYIEDESGALLFFISDHTMVAGQKISGLVKGSITWYNQGQEITALDLSEAEVEDGAEIPLTEITLAELLKDDDTYYSNLFRMLKISDVTITDAISDGDRNGKVKQGETEVAVYAQLNGKGLVLNADESGDLIAIAGIHDTSKQLLFWDNAWFTKK